MGLDWCLSDKPKPGVDYAEFLAARDGGDEMRDAYNALACSPMETVGVPQVGIDQAATDYFLKDIVPSHREAINKGTNPPHVEAWGGTDEELVAKHHGDYLPELAEAYKLSTITGMIAGAFSFRGKAVGYSELIGEELQNEAYGDMNPYEMSTYAKRIEDSAIESVKEQLKEAGLPADLISDAPMAKDWVDGTSRTQKERALADGFTFEDWAGYVKYVPDGSNDNKRVHFESNKVEDIADKLSVILDASRWLRFWADLGHSMWAWS